MQAKVNDVEASSALLARIAQGSEAALKDFYHAYHGRVYAFALRRLNDSADAADVLNEVMLEVWRKAERFEGRSQPLTWVLGIAHHKVLDSLRRRKAHLNEDDAGLDQLADEGPTAGDALAGAQDAERLRRCLEELSDAHRQVVHLAYFEDLPYPEIADIVDCPVGTVKTRMFHAKQLLKRCLGRAA
jgi:RNA polymerase sigma-70 factor, ECF subfamily